MKLEELLLQWLLLSHQMIKLMKKDIVQYKFFNRNGVNGLLAAGTSGESATTHEDKKKIEILIDEAKGRVITIGSRK